MRRLNLFETAEARLVLEDGSVFAGVTTVPGTAFGEVVFNTSMTGYQEILTDPSYRGQIVVMTQPHIGNYGVAEEVAEAARPWVEGFVARRFTEHPSQRNRPAGLVRYLREHGVVALEGVDTRALVRRVREQGAMRGVITSSRSDVEALRTELAAIPSMLGRALVGDVSCSEPYEVEPQGPAPVCHLAVYDFGVKANILRSLAQRAGRLTVLPWNTPAAACLERRVDGVVLSNGPGDPEPLTEAVETIRELVEAGLPLFGICLGHQLLALALGGRTFKLKFGHHGGNQPVRDARDGRVWITAQNHGFAVDPDSLPEDCRVTHVNLNDGTVEGFAVEGRPIYAVQYHPEAAPGPHDARELFDAFLEVVRRRGARQ